MNDFSKDSIAFPNITFTCGSHRTAVMLVLSQGLLSRIAEQRELLEEYSNESSRSFSRNSSLQGTKPGTKLSH